MDHYPVPVTIQVVEKHARDRMHDNDERYLSVGNQRLRYKQR